MNLTYRPTLVRALDNLRRSGLDLDELRSRASVVCWGAGVDSTAMLVLMSAIGWRPDAITFADTGAEKPETYDFIPVMEQYLSSIDFPSVTHCRYTPKDDTHARYRAATVEAARVCGVQATDREIDRLAGLFGNVVANETLPGLAFAQKSCSMKWKLEAQEPMRCVIPELVEAWGRGERVTKLIGYDATEDHRAKPTYASGNLSIGSGPGIPAYKDRYAVEYLLRAAGLDRDGCCRLIAEAGLPVPVKSACFFCPAMSQIEIARLRSTHPELYELAAYMERTYRGGKHFKGDACFTITAKHKATGERLKFDTFADGVAEARGFFRSVVGDTGRPFQWSVNVRQSVVGLLGRKRWEAA